MCSQEFRAVFSIKNVSFLSPTFISIKRQIIINPSLLHFQTSLLLRKLFVFLSSLQKSLNLSQTLISEMASKKNLTLAEIVDMYNMREEEVDKIVT